MRPLLDKWKGLLLSKKFILLFLFFSTLQSKSYDHNFNRLIVVPIHL